LGVHEFLDLTQNLLRFKIVNRKNIKRLFVIACVGVLCICLHPYRTLSSEVSLFQRQQQLISMAATTSNTATIYVSPLGQDTNPGTQKSPVRSLTRAQVLARKAVSQKRNVLVYLRGGRYELSAPLRFDQNDTLGNQQVTYAAYPGDKPVLSGGEPIRNWQSASGGLFTAKVGSQFRQLYINGRPATRARFPNQDQYLRLRHWYFESNIPVTSVSKANRVIVAEARDLQGVEIPTDGSAEMVIQRDWAQVRLRIQALRIAGISAIFSFKQPESDLAFDAPYPYKYQKQSYHLENSFSFLDAPGEWFLDKQNNLSYKPRSGESVSKLNAIAPKLETLIEVTGTASQPVQNLELRGLTFTDTTWVQPSQFGRVGHFGPVSEAAPVQGRARATLPSTVTVRYAKNFKFQFNRIQNSGGNGIILGVGVENSLISGNVVQDTAAAGIVLANLPVLMPNVYHFNDDRRPQVCAPRIAQVTGPLPPEFIVRKNQVSNNFITRVGRDYPDNSGIIAAYIADTKIEHNQLVDMPYSGIAVGWAVTEIETGQRNNLIRANDISRVMRLMTDGGGIYHVSASPGTRIMGNYVHDLRLSPWPARRVFGGIFLDMGTKGVTVADNVILNFQTDSSKGPHDLTIPIASNAKKEHNVIRNNEGRSSKVISEAGLQPAFRGIRPQP
jgi:hypothetical protein